MYIELDENKKFQKDNQNFWSDIGITNSVLFFIRFILLLNFIFTCLHQMQNWELRSSIDVESRECRFGFQPSIQRLHSEEFWNMYVFNTNIILWNNEGITFSIFANATSTCI
jgi:hypothetical protein